MPVTNATADQLNAIIEATDPELFEDEEYMTGIMGTNGYHTIAFDNAYVWHKDGSFDAYITLMGHVDFDLSNALSKTIDSIRKGCYVARRVRGNSVLSINCKNDYAPNYAIRDAREDLDTHDFTHCFDGRSGGHLCLDQYAGRYGHMRYDCDDTDTMLDICNTIDSLVDITRVKDLSTLTTTLTSIASQVAAFKAARWDDELDDEGF